MSNTGATLDDKNFQRALRRVCELRGITNIPQELRRRAKNVGFRLVNIYKKNGVQLQQITQKVRSLEASRRVKIRPGIRAKGRANGLSYKQLVGAEIRARRSAKGFTATGWFPAVERLGGKPKRQIRGNGGPRRGKLIEKLGRGEMSETLVNQQPGAGHVQGKSRALEQQALDAETADMVVYIVRKMNEAARRNGL